MNKKKIKHLGYFCIGPTVTYSKIKKLKNKIKEEKELDKIGKYFAILSGKTRLKILYLLKEEKELCVCDIADILGATVSAVSHQLKILRVAGLVEFSKKAQTIFYFLSKEGKKEIKNHF